MCGITGFTFEDDLLIRDMIEVSKMRGPDGSHYKVGDGFTLGFSHLNISQPDGKGVMQPYTTGQSNILCWNGEIYGIQASDTKWLGEMLDNYGPEVMRSFNGMWSVAFVDRKNKELHLLRDHFGTKPLYYTIIKENLFFASSVKSLLGIKGVDVSVNANFVDVYQKYEGHIPGPETIYKGIKKVSPGEHLIWSLPEKKFVGKKTLFDYKLTNLDEERFDEEFFRQRVISLIMEASRCRHKTGISLSGGIDSNLLFHIIAKQNTIDLSAFSTNYVTTNSDIHKEIKEDLNMDWVLAKQSAVIANKNIFIEDITDREFLEDSYNIHDIMGHPIQDRARWYPRLRLNKLASSLGVKVMYNGDGGDELVTGYSSDKHRSPETGTVGAEDLVHNNEFLNEYFKTWLPYHVFGDDVQNNTRLGMALVHLERANTQSDACAAFWGMESRPLLCHQKLAFFLLQIPSKIKFKTPAPEYYGIYKYLFRELFKDIIPSIITEKVHKRGWSAPWDARDIKRNFQLQLEDVYKSVEKASSTIQFNSKVL